MLQTLPTQLEAVRRPVRSRLREVERELLSMVPSGLDALDEVGEYLFSRSGKLFRPTLLLLANGVGDHPSTEAVKLAAIVELLHVATLVHDDAVDHSVRRRGMPTVNDRWTHQVAIIAGDYLYSRAVIEITSLGRLEPIGILARTANQMTIGEMRQLVLHDRLDFTRADYDRLCEHKTASLLSAACELGAMAGRAEFRTPLRAYGYQLGMAFQITDDLLDYTARADETGKPSGQDLREHKVTLPLIESLPSMSPGERALVEALFCDPDPNQESVAEVIDVVAHRGGIDAARREAGVAADRARERLEGLPEGACTEALGRAVEYVVERIR
ncbi:MAG: polyprenyl synthetase family protein [Gemmatimonadota bacterium]